MTTEFIWAGGLLMAQIGSDGNTFAWHYDQSGKMMGFSLNNVPYFYLRNLQGDIVAILDAAGNVVAEYAYDVWGNQLTEQIPGSIGEKNPIRYRGYYYDNETGFYYCQSRYYNPVWCRWISGDVFMDTKVGILGTNMYAYCSNDPVNLYDSSGLWGEDIHRGPAYGTIYWAKSLGISDTHAKRIANANASVDGDFWKGPANPAGFRYHFKTRGSEKTFQTHFNNALGLWESDQNAALDELGIALHALQDTFAHSDWKVFGGAARTVFGKPINADKFKQNFQHIAWNEGRTSWKTDVFDKVDFNVVKGAKGLFYYEDVGMLNNPRYLDTQDATKVALEVFIILTKYQRVF